MERPSRPTIQSDIYRIWRMSAFQENLRKRDLLVGVALAVPNRDHGPL